MKELKKAVITTIFSILGVMAVVWAQNAWNLQFSDFGAYATFAAIFMLGYGCMILEQKIETAIVINRVARRTFTTDNNGLQ